MQRRTAIVDDRSNERFMRRQMQAPLPGIIPVVMNQILMTIGNDVLSTVLGIVIPGALAWFNGRIRKPSAEVVERKVESLVAHNLPESVPAADRQELIAALTEIAYPTFEQVVRFSPSTGMIVEVASRSTKKTAAKKSAGDLPKRGSGASSKSATKRTAAKRSSTIPYPAKKSAAKKSAAKSAAPKSAAKKSATRKTATKSAARKTSTKKTAAEKAPTKKTAAKKTVSSKRASLR